MTAEIAAAGEPKENISVSGGYTDLGQTSRDRFDTETRRLETSGDSSFLMGICPTMLTTEGTKEQDLYKGLPLVTMNLIPTMTVDPVREKATRALSDSPLASYSFQAKI